jgi:hypothetical protein
MKFTRDASYIANLLRTLLRPKHLRPGRPPSLLRQTLGLTALTISSTYAVREPIPYDDRTQTEGRPSRECDALREGNEGLCLEGLHMKEAPRMVGGGWTLMGFVGEGGG